MSAFTVRCLHEPAEVLMLSAQIDALNLACEQPDPFSTAEFYDNFLRRGLLLPQSDAQLWFLAVFQDNALVGYLALRRSTRKVCGLTTPGLEFLVGHEADRPHLVARPKYAEAVARVLFDYLLRRRDQWSWMELQGQTASSSLDPARLGVSLPGCMIREFPNWENCSIQLRWNSLQQYVQALPKSMRSDLRRRLRRLLALGRLEVLTSTDPRSTPPLFDLYCSIEQRSWKSQTEVAIGGAVRAEYMHGLLDARQPMRMVVQILLLDGVPIAGLISGSFATPSSKTLYALHLAYDKRLAAASPGSAVLLMGVRYAIENHYGCMNLLAGFAYYKTRWLAQTTALRSIQVFRIGTPLFWRRLLGDAWRRLRPEARATTQPQDHSRAIAETSQECELVTSDVERRRFVAKIAQAHLGRCESTLVAEVASTIGIVPNCPLRPLAVRARA